jgi:Flp pilus assembly protein TadG
MKAVRVSVFTRLAGLLRGFAAASTGNVAITFGLAVMPVFGLVGSAVDYGRIHSVKAGMQTAVDATALMLAKEAVTATNGQLQANAQTYFKANFSRPDANNATASATYAGGTSSKLAVNASASVPTTFMKMFGYDAVTVTASSTAKWGNSRLRVALALDNTGSMASDSKIAALKTATNNLIQQLQSAAENTGDVFVSLVPFSKDVNLDPANYGASWIDWTTWDTLNGACTKSGYTTKSTCNSHSGVWTPANHNTWNGCVVDRGNSSGPASAAYDTNVLAPVPGTAASLFAAEQYDSCAQAALPLTDNWTAMNTLVNGMTPGGNTNQGIGLAVGWMSLAGGGPFTTPPMDPNYEYKQVIVLLTDGLNTQNRWYTTQSSIDTRQRTTCTNIKNAGITLYTVQVNTGGDPTSTLLKNCATDSGKFFELKQADAIVSTFQSIGVELTQLFVSQ